MSRFHSSRVALLVFATTLPASSACNAMFGIEEAELGSLDGGPEFPGESGGADGQGGATAGVGGGPGGGGRLPGGGGTAGAGGGSGAGGSDCGDFIVEGTEECDGPNLSFQTCATATMSAMPYGTLGCLTNCRFDTAGCSGVPGGAGGAVGSGGAPSGAGGAGTGGLGTGGLGTGGLTLFAQLIEVISCNNGARTCDFGSGDAMECTGGTWRVAASCKCGCSSLWLASWSGFDDPCNACAAE